MQKELLGLAGILGDLWWSVRVVVAISFFGHTVEYLARTWMADNQKKVESLQV